MVRILIIPLAIVLSTLAQATEYTPSEARALSWLSSGKIPLDLVKGFAPLNPTGSRNSRPSEVVDKKVAGLVISDEPRLIRKAEQAFSHYEQVPVYKEFETTEIAPDALRADD